MTWSVLYNITCVDVGATQGQSRYIQQLKRDMYNQRVTIDNVLSFKSMPKILSDFKGKILNKKSLKLK